MTSDPKAKQKTQKKKKRRRILKITFFLLLIFFCGLILYGSDWYYNNVMLKAPDIDQIDVTPTGYLSKVLDSDGNEIASMVASGSNRVYVTLDEIPLTLQHAFVAVEDSRFYKHHGIDLKGISRAFFKGLKSRNFSEGASTITQQLLKNNVFVNWTKESSFEEKLERKLQEQYLAMSLERKESKEWILENYLNTINLGQNTLGVQAAANRYFNKDVSDLNLSESTVIAGITKNPSAYNPIDHQKKNEERRKIVLDDMLDQGYITQKDYQDALEDDVYERIQAVNQEKNDKKEINSYFIDALTEQVIHDLMEKKAYSKTEAYKALYNGGLTIYSTQSTKLQKICEEEINRQENYDADSKYSFSYQLTVKKADGTYQNYNEQTLLKYYKEQSGDYKLLYYSKDEAKAAIDAYRESVVEEGDTVQKGDEKISYSLQPQASLTLIDQKTGEVRAIVGGRGEKEANLTLNRATSTTRQPGSTFKILSTFAPALDTANKTLATVEDDAPFFYSDGKTPVNNYDGRYRGFTTYREAIRDSINIVTVKALTEIGTQIGYDYLLNFGFTTLTEDDNRQTMALGGISKGVTNLELTAAYASIANEGIYTKPRFYTRILDHDGNILIDNKPQTKEVIKKSTAALLTNAMQDVLTDGSGTLARIDWLTTAGKSGTTTSNRDLWFAGYSPYYTCAVWGGFDNNYTQEDTTYVKKIWKSVMSRIHEGYEDIGFDLPKDLIKRRICQKSGLLAKTGCCDCDPRGSMVKEEYFLSGTEPSEYCTCHVKMTLCTVSHLPANKYCRSTEEKVYLQNVTPGTEDYEYAATPEFLASECTFHKPIFNLPSLFKKKDEKDSSDKNDSTNPQTEDNDASEDDDSEDDDSGDDDFEDDDSGDDDSEDDSTAPVFEPDSAEDEEDFWDKLDIFDLFH